MNDPMQGVRVIDFSHVLSGPYGTRLLADMGADVIRVEAPGGDPFLLWLAPVLFLVIAAWILRASLRRRTPLQGEATLSVEEEARLAALLGDDERVAGD